MPQDAVNTGQAEVEMTPTNDPIEMDSNGPTQFDQINHSPVDENLKWKRVCEIENVGEETSKIQKLTTNKNKKKIQSQNVGIEMQQVVVADSIVDNPAGQSEV